MFKGESDEEETLRKNNRSGRKEPEKRSALETRREERFKENVVSNVRGSQAVRGLSIW